MSAPQPLWNIQEVPRLARAIVWVVFGTLGVWLAAVTIFEDMEIAAAYVPPRHYADVLKGIGGQIEMRGGAITGARMPAALPFLGAALLAGATWLTGGWAIAKRRNIDFVDALAAWGSAGWPWWLVPGGWALAVLFLSGSNGGVLPFLKATSEFAIAFGFGGWLATFGWLVAAPTASDSESDRGAARLVLIAIGVYILVFTGMNWGLWFNLRIPHGDSAMYEEHLWNVEHGKGFRSYLDPGLFLGEHIQIIHLALIPLHLIWPSHLLMELCESAALASGAWFVFRMTQNQTGSARIGAWLGVAYLMYAPLQYLDIEIDLKTFRPEAFGVPLLLWTLWQIDRRRWTLATVGLLLTLSVKEDYPIIFAPLGLWIALFGGSAPTNASAATPGSPSAPAKSHFARWYGIGLAVASCVYLLLAVKLVIPWFRGQVQVHYVSYFAKFGKTTSEVMWNMLTRPGLLWNELVQVRTAMYASHLVVPLAGLCLLAPTRLAVGGPLFVLLCLNELAQQPPTPVHHFHAPIVAVLFWSAAAGLGRISRSSFPWLDRFHVLATGVAPAPPPAERARTLAIMAASCAGLSAAVVGFSPLSLRFWEPGQTYYWRNLYVPGERPREFAKVYGKIPIGARVASTDFVHPRFTHHERSYDYSQYARAVAGFTTSVPADTDYIVIDTQHPYSVIKAPADIRELRQHPDEWELLPDETAGYFLVLKRKAANPAP